VQATYQITALRRKALPVIKQRIHFGPKAEVFGG
jgi:hypothetical protein